MKWLKLLLLFRVWVRICTEQRLTAEKYVSARFFSPEQLGYQTGTRRVPDGYQTGTPPSQVGTRRVPNGYQTGTPHSNRVNNAKRDGYQTGTRRVPDGYQTGTRRVPDGYQTGTRRVPDGYQTGTPRVPTRDTTVHLKMAPVCKKNIYTVLYVFELLDADTFL